MTPTSEDTPRGERTLIRRLAPLVTRAWPVELARVCPFGDDMAPVHAEPPLLATVDMLMDGVDFDSGQTPWELIGRKSVAVSLSDCAAMAVRPTTALIAVSLDERMSGDDALALHRGAVECAAAFGCILTGGDTNSWRNPTVVAVTVFGVPMSLAGVVRRDGARAGDRLWVSGPVGGSILGRHLTFTPRLELARALVEGLRPHAMIDISDGASLDLARLCEASGVAAVLDETLVDAATHADARQLAAQDGRPAREHALADGEDFELLIALPADAPADVCGELGLLPLGEFVAGTGLRLRSPGGRETELTPSGWEHFR